MERYVEKLWNSAVRCAVRYDMKTSFSLVTYSYGLEIDPTRPKLLIPPIRPRASRILRLYQFSVHLESLPVEIQFQTIGT